MFVPTKVRLYEQATVFFVEPMFRFFWDDMQIWHGHVVREGHTPFSACGSEDSYYGHQFREE